jgi:outer membrane protein assembly factor BamB
METKFKGKSIMNRKNKTILNIIKLIFILSLLNPLAVSHGKNWPNWRGPFFNGSTDESNLPSIWSKTENIKWIADLPRSSAATPIIWNNRIFISGLEISSDELLAMCFDRKNGKLLWKYKITEGIRRDRRSTYAAPSPTTDGKNVIFFYSSGDLVCFDFDGNQQWKRNVHNDYGQFSFFWTFASSPVLFEGKLFLQVLQRDVPVRGRGKTDRKNDSYLLAMNPASGETIWRHIRPTEAILESHEAFSTPIPGVIYGTKQLIVAGGDILTGHELSTGKELWRWGTWNPNRNTAYPLIPSPVLGKDIVLVCGPKREPVYCIQPQNIGDLDQNAVLWDSKNISNDMTSNVPTPAFYEGDFFILSDLRKTLMRVAAKTGKIKWQIDSPGRAKYEASPLVGDGKVYIINHDGEAAIINAANGDILRSMTMDDPNGGELVRASVCASDGQLFIRTTRQLFCIEEKQN